MIWSQISVAYQWWVFQSVQCAEIINSVLEIKKLKMPGCINILISLYFASKFQLEQSSLKNYQFVQILASETGLSIKLLKKPTYMGCEYSEVKPFLDRELRVRHENPKIGVMEIKINNLFLARSNKTTKNVKQHLILRVQVSNQFEEFNVDEISTQPGKETVCRFFINSMYKEYGRILTMEVWNATGNQDDIAIGFHELQPFIYPDQKKVSNFHVSNKHRKCCLNSPAGPGGFIQIDPCFKEQKYVEITFRLITAQIRRPKSDTKNFFARIIVGEEIYQSGIVVIHERNQPIEFSHDSKATFKVPQSLETGLVQLIARVGNSDNLLGSLSLDLKTLAKKQMQIDQQLTIDTLDQITGEIIIFSAPNMLHLKKSEDIENMELPSPRKKPRPRALTSLQNIRPISIAKMDDDQASAPRKKNSSPEKNENVKSMKVLEQIEKNQKAYPNLYPIKEQQNSLPSPTPVIQVKKPPSLNLIKVVCKVEKEGEEQEKKQPEEKQQSQFNPESQMKILNEAETIKVPKFMSKNGNAETKKNSLPPLEVRQALMQMRGRRQRKKSVCL